MNNIITALIIGVIAGAIDISPMIKQKMPKFTIASVFAQWVFIGLIIPFISWNLDPWLKGLVVAELGMLPMMILVLEKYKSKLPTIILFTAVLGIAIGIASDKFIGKSITFLF